MGWPIAMSTSLFRVQAACLVPHGLSRYYRAGVPHLTPEVLSSLVLAHDIETGMSLNKAFDIVNKILLRSIETAFEAHTIDYNDQLYIPAVFGGSFDTYDVVIVDEAQDLSPVQLEMISQIIKPRFATHRGAWFIAVGDPHQAIYAFRGADAQAVETTKTRFKCEEITLTTCFRCDSSIV